MDFKQCILLGLPDVGVQDHAIELAQRWNVPHVSMESLLQEAIAAQTEIGRQAAPYVEAGKQIPDELAVRLIRKRLQQTDVMLNGWVVDGFPATIAQAEALDELLTRVGLPTATVVYLKAMTGLLVNRVWTRNKQTETMPIIRQRLAQQEQQLFPLVEHYQRRSQLKTINGSLPFAEVARDLFHLGYSDTGAAQLIKDEAELDSLISQESVLVVDCLASWCGPCKLVAPLIDQLADDYGIEIHFHYFSAIAIVIGQLINQWGNQL
ncbi:MAG: AAA family ATPase, partial [Merismopedia sp. SIO2A8]|nr:AAA family ATPase [Merismopedia sp. SIO2A8]